MSKAEQIPFDLAHRPAFAREDFWVSASNADAIAWIDKWPAWPAPALIVVAPIFGGKTHLAQVWQHQTGAHEISPSDLAKTPPDQLLGVYKTVLLDNADQGFGVAAYEENLFHLYNIIRDRAGSLLLTSSKPIKECAIQLADLKSRLLAAPSAIIQSPDTPLMAVILNKLFSDRQIFVSQDVIDYILSRIERSFLALNDFVRKIDNLAMAEKRAITIPLVKQIIG